MSNGKADPGHHPSFKSCQIRLPNSINSKYLDNRDKRLSEKIKVKTLQKWNGRRRSVTREFLEEYRTYLEQKVTDQENNTYNYNYNNTNIKQNKYSSSSRFEWIEKLLETPIKDYRKWVLWQILCPYLVNIKKLSDDDLFQILKDWLNKCNSIRRLDFNPNQKIRDSLKHVRDFYPIGIYKLKTDEEYSKLYQILKEKIELNISKNNEVKT